MASLKELRRRIRSVKSTQQITKAMEMVAAAKLRRAQARALAARPYAAKLFAGLADALASQYSAQMIAMGAARKNAGELIDLLILQRNRLRQAAITKELLDIVGGAEALK